MKADPNDRGETLIELLVTVIIVGVAVVALVGGIATSVRMSDIHRKQAQAGAYVRAFGEAIENSVSTGAPTKYTACAGTATYSTAYPAHPDGGTAYTAAITAVTYWNPTSNAFAASCTTDSGVQKVSLKVSTSDNKVAETLDVIIRKPCRSTTDFPSESPCA
ncbi:prepilin-type N-terminal cleavage/methylation domain-containing protein [Dactylosporangium sp. NPDC051485]|uniref:prepilin-type N-terminal cleavage/methylation domain-containing protein n=1 Tax=Dactylosporangium sp. NPDC051485 TaxID=3154846 RepID=UPI00341E2284